MNGSSLARLDGEDRDVSSRQPFLATHRALGACTRELARLSTGVAAGVAALHSAGTAPKPVVRQSPGRCIVQLGPVALTMTWLRSTLDSVGEGELLVVVWNGSVGPQADPRPERIRAARAPIAASVWEDVLVAQAHDETTWTWRSRGAEIGAYSSAELAQRCVARLQTALDAHQPTA